MYSCWCFSYNAHRLYMYIVEMCYMCSFYLHVHMYIVHVYIHTLYSIYLEFNARASRRRGLLEEIDQLALLCNSGLHLGLLDHVSLCRHPLLLHGPLSGRRLATQLAFLLTGLLQHLVMSGLQLAVLPTQGVKLGRGEGERGEGGKMREQERGKKRGDVSGEGKRERRKREKIEYSTCGYTSYLCNYSQNLLVYE